MRQNVLAVVLLALVAAGSLTAEGCGNHDKAAARFTRNTPPATVGLMRVHFAEQVTGSEAAKALDAIRAHYTVVSLDLHFAVVYHLNQSWPQGTIDVWVHPGVTLGSKFMEPVPGRLDPDGSVHVAMGGCAEVPDLVRQAAHAYWHPNPDENVLPLFWDEVRRRQKDSVAQVLVSRTCR